MICGGWYIIKIVEVRAQYSSGLYVTLPLNLTEIQATLTKMAVSLFALSRTRLLYPYDVRPVTIAV